MARHSPAKITLAMMKGKPITTSVPSIRYHASDDELEELYPEDEDEKRKTPDSESSPCKSGREKTEDNDEVFEKRSSSVDGSLSEGTPPSDRWKMFSDFKGKLTKTLEEKLQEIKSEKKKRSKSGRSRKNSSVSDPEDLGDVTPTEDFVPEKQERESSTIRRRGNRFGSFGIIKTGLKAKNSEDYSVESGVEAAELGDENSSPRTSDDTQNEKIRVFPAISGKIINTDCDRSEFSQLKRLLIWEFFTIPFVLWSFYYFIPLPTYLVGIIAGMFVLRRLQNVMEVLKKFLTTPNEMKSMENEGLEFVEIEAAEEHAVVDRFEGWLNELPYDYDPDNYHVARTVSVFFKLEAESLRIMETRTRIPKRAVWNEPQHVAKFTRKRVYSLAGAKIELLPDGLTRRRRWSKKYPICVTFCKEGVIESVDLNTGSDEESQKTDNEKDKTIFEMEEANVEEDDEDDDDDDFSQSKDSKDVFADCRGGDDDDDDDDDQKSKFKIYVFARTDRQKEDWYRRLVRATCLSSKRNSISSTKDITPSSSLSSIATTAGDPKNSTINASEFTSELSYNAYMSRYIDGGHMSGKSGKYQGKASSCREKIEIDMNRRGSRFTPSTIREYTGTWCYFESVGLCSCLSILEVRNNEWFLKKIFNRTQKTNSSQKNQPDPNKPTQLDNTSTINQTQTCGCPGDTPSAQSTPSTEIGPSLVDNDVIWLNALLGRVLFDMHKSPDAINLIQEKIQRKLSNIKLPYFMQSLLITELVIGQGAPVIHKATKPVLDEHGLSVDLDMTYEGCLTMTIETKLNLMKLTRAGSVSVNSNDIVNTEKPKPARSPIFDSDVEDSPETSTEEEDATNLPSNSGSRESTPTQSSGRKFLSMVDKLAANRYFQHAAELSYVRRAMEGLSNTEIRLMVNVSSIKGCLTVNIPPPPSDRIWYGFKPVPRIILTAKPAVGEMAVNIGYVTKWIETKLLKEFERVVVLPNMDDLLISLCPNYPFHDA